MLQYIFFLFLLSIWPVSPLHWYISWSPAVHWPAIYLIGLHCFARVATILILFVVFETGWFCLQPLAKYATVWHSMTLVVTIWLSLAQYCTACHRMKLFGTILQCLAPYGSIWHSITQFGSLVWHCFAQFGTFWHVMALFGTVCHCLSQ